MAEAIPQLQRSPAMKTMSLRKESDPPECNPSARNALRHQCPVCNTLHYVSTVRAQFAYGRQLACSPDCEAERRRRSRASYRLAPKPIAGGRGTLHLVGAHAQSAVLCVTVESTDVLCVRRAAFQSGGGSVGILKVTPVPHSSKLRLSIGTKADAVELIMTAIMRAVTACEFGRIARI
jgi:hypothetical protein